MSPPAVKRAEELCELMEYLKGENKMNQLEREEFFMGTEEQKKELPISIRRFSPQGNHKRSLVGECWYYLSECEETYNLLKDEVVEQDESGVWIQLWKDNEPLIENRVHLSYGSYQKIYPIQELFPTPLQEEEAIRTLKEYFKKQRSEERSTTIETQGE